MIVDDHLLDGERLLVPERVIVAPAAGRFEPAPPDVVTTEGEIVERGQVVGSVKGPGLDAPVRSVFRGFMMGLLAHDGERVREGQPIAWLRVF